MSILANIFGKYTQVRRQGSGTIVQRDMPVAASQTIKAGDWLTMTSSSADTVQQALGASNNTATANGSGLKIIGVALTNITTDSNGIATDGTGRNTLPVAIIDDSTEVLLKLHNSTGATAEPQDVYIGQDYNLVRWQGASSAINWYAMSAASPTNAMIKVVEKSIESSADEDYGLVWVKVLAANRSLG